jgi:peptidoglycan/LPS O-acetylase OafA/YrhL
MGDPGSTGYFTRNNFDLVRLFAAYEVVIVHAGRCLQVLPERVLHCFEFFAGVPIFFFISGFLISASWERNPKLSNFARNRFLRICPALWTAFAFSLVLIVSLGSVHVGEHIGTLLLWALAQTTFLQSWNPQFLRAWGIGVANGALWTIPVEMSFYAAIPILYFLGRRFKAIDILVVVVAGLSFGLQYWTQLTSALPSEFVRKAIFITPLPWVGMFCVGIFAQRHIAKIYPLVAGRLPQFLVAYLAVAIVSSFVPGYPLIGSAGNSIALLSYGLLCATVLAAAYTGRDTAERLLHRNDISYGVYVYHLPCINAAMAIGLPGVAAFACVLVAVPALAVLSWHYIERPCLGSRRAALFVRTEPTAETAKTVGATS